MRLKVVAVSGASMEPSYSDGDWLLANFSASKRLPKQGAVVVIEREEQPGIFYVKRIKEISAAGIYVLSDNPAGTDSRTWSYLDQSEIRARVIGRVRKTKR